MIPKISYMALHLLLIYLDVEAHSVHYELENKGRTGKNGIVFFA